MPEKNIVYASPLLAAALIDKSMGPFEHLVWSNNYDYKYDPNPTNEKGEEIPNALEKNKAVQKMISDWSDENFKDHDDYIDFLLSGKTNGEENYFTDDTMLTMAVAYTFNSYKYRSVFGKIKKENITDEERLRDYYRQLDEDLFVNFCKFSKRYPKCFGECGGAFQELVIELSRNNNKYMSDDEIREAYRTKKSEVRSEKYNGYDTKSWGNGSAMRVSSCAYVANSLTEARVLAELSAISTHESDIGIKAAQAVTSFIYLARLGLDKKTIKAYMNYMYRTKNPICISGDPAESFITSWDFDNLTIDKIKEKGYPYCIRADLTVIPAIVAVLEADNYLDACKLISKLGADSDTMGLITASMAAALYGTPEILIEEGKNKLKEIQYDSKIIINSHEDNSGTKDNLMFKINQDFDKNFSSGYRGNADKNWQLSQINQILDDLKMQDQNLSEINKTKKKDFKNLVKLMNEDLNRIENKINVKDLKMQDQNLSEINKTKKKDFKNLVKLMNEDLNRIENKIDVKDLKMQDQNLSEINKTKKKDFKNLVKLMNEDLNRIENKIDVKEEKEKKSDCGNKKSAFKVLRDVDRKLELCEYGKKINAEDKKKKLEEVISSLVSFVDNFDLGLNEKEKENLKQEIKSKKDVSWFRSLIERIKYFFVKGKAVGSEEGKIIIAKQRLNGNKEILKQFFIDKNRKDKDEKVKDKSKDKTKEIYMKKDRE